MRKDSKVPKCQYCDKEFAITESRDTGIVEGLAGFGVGLLKTWKSFGTILLKDQAKTGVKCPFCYKLMDVCPKCGEYVRAPIGLYGETVICGNCQTAFMAGSHEEA